MSKMEPKEECEMSYPEQYLQFITQFNRGNYYECHDLLEEIWLGDRQNHFLKGLLQLAVALHHLSYGNVKGARLLLASAQDYLSFYPARYWGISIVDVLQYIRQVEALLPVAGTLSIEEIHKLNIPVLILSVERNENDIEEERI